MIFDFILSRNSIKNRVLTYNFQTDHIAKIRILHGYGYYYSQDFYTEFIEFIIKSKNVSRGSKSYKNLIRLNCLNFD